MNVVKNRGEEICLEVKELMGMGENIVNEYKEGFNDSIRGVKNRVWNWDLLVDKEEWEE